MNNQVKFIYLDVGGVVILDFSKTNKWDRMATDLDLEGKVKEDFFNLFGQYEGNICLGQDTEEFVTAAKKELKIEFPENYNMLADFVNRFELNESIHPVLQELEKKYKLGLLTNMYPGMLDAIESRGLLPQVSWDNVVDSSTVKYKKPQKEIFEIAQREANLPVENLLFIDNSERHVEAAKSLGWQGLLYDPADLGRSNERLIQLLH